MKGPHEGEREELKRDKREEGNSTMGEDPFKERDLYCTTHIQEKSAWIKMT